MSATRKLWLGLAVLLTLSFGVLLWAGTEIFRTAPPMPEKVLSESGQVIYTRADMEQGRQVWQSMGGMQLGSIWGHGGYVAPDWSADWLHRESVSLLDLWARADGGMATYAQLPEEQQAALRARLKQVMRTNTYDAATGTITLPDDRALALSNVAAHYESLFGNDPATATLREAYAMKNDTVPDASHRRALTAFFWWTAWAAGTERPLEPGDAMVPSKTGVVGKQVTYTNNWPSEPLIDNTPAPAMWVWSSFSVLFLIAGIGLLGWWHARQAHEEPLQLPASDPLAAIRITPSMRATAKYFWVVLALFLVQILLGAITAHYQVEGQQAYGFALSDVLPYSITRTWHTQLAVLWIAVAWLGTGLYIAPAMSGHEPKFQRLGVNFLWTCLLLIVVGSFAGQWLAVMQKLGLEHNFWWGHQGWEYADMGRFWQWFLFVGLLLWLTLVGRALWPVLRGPATGTRSIVGLLFLSTVCIGLFFASALMWGEHTHISDGRVLALVAGPPVGGRLLRSVRHRGDGADLHPPGPDQGHRGTVAVLFATIVFMAAACWAPCIIFTSSARRPRWWRWARASARWKWCRWPTSASRRTTPTSWARPRRGWPATAGRSCSSSRSASGTWWAPACSAS
jgi:nitric oxide reductase subunit B